MGINVIRLFCIMAVLACSTYTVGLSQDWTPPKNPDPDLILSEARADTRAKRYEDALAKHVWFHENALQLKPALYGVRLSFALSYWGELNEQYPPSLKKFKEIRDQAMKDVLSGKNVREMFHDLSSLNEELGEERVTRKAFESLQVKDPENAKRVFDLAKPVLLRAKLYRLVGKHVEPEKDFSRMTKEYESMKKYEDQRGALGNGSFAEKSFTNSATTLIAILVVNERVPEAKKIAEKAKKVWDDETFHAEIDEALEGVVPEPWP